MLLTASEKQAVKKLALDDLFFFTRDVLGYDLLTDRHLSWCDDLSYASYPRRLILRPRGTYKSTIYTIGYPLWRAIKNPDMAIMITNAIGENAQGFLHEIAGHVRINDVLRWLFGDLSDGSEKWRQNSIVLPTRERPRKEGSIDARGSSAQITSAHYDLIIVDDWVNNEDRESSTVRQKKKRWFQDLLSILNPDGELIVVGTRWHFDDLYQFIIQEVNPKLSGNERYVIEIDSALDAEGKPTYPDILSLEKLETLRIEKGLIEFNSQYLNDPLPAECQIFNIDQFHLFDMDDLKPEELMYFGACDPSMGKSKTSDYSAITTLARNAKGQFCVIECDIQRRNPDRIITDIIAAAKRYPYRRFVFENNQFQDYVKSQLIEAAIAQGVNVPIVGIPSTSNKEMRIQSLQSPIANGYILFRKDWRQAYPLLIEMLQYYPIHGYDDGPDSLEMAYSQNVTSMPKVFKL